YGRNAWAMFTEAQVPILKTLEANFAVRFDHYSDFGGTTNPKLSLRWQPSRTLLLRASVGTGFRAPELDSIHYPYFYGTTGNLDDPLRCPITRSAQDCGVNFNARFGGNPVLQPERSTQWGAGGVWSAAPGIVLGLDYYDIQLKDAIIAPSTAALFGQCPDGINGPGCPYIHRGPVDPRFPNLPGPITLVDLFWVNFAN